MFLVMAVFCCALRGYVILLGTGPLCRQGWREGRQVMSAGMEGNVPGPSSCSKTYPVPERDGHCDSTFRHRFYIMPPAVEMAGSPVL